MMVEILSQICSKESPCQNFCSRRTINFVSLLCPLSCCDGDDDDGDNDDGDNDDGDNDDSDDDDDGGDGDDDDDGGGYDDNDDDDDIDTW